MELEQIPNTSVRDRHRQGNHPLAKGGAQHLTGCDSHIKLCVLLSIPKYQQMGQLNTIDPEIGA
eukprot:10062941-Ditylum_brightwellii.AAC.1